MNSFERFVAGYVISIGGAVIGEFQYHNIWCSASYAHNTLVANVCYLRQMRIMSDFGDCYSEIGEML